MRLRNIGTNETEIEINGKTILFSYNTPVAGRDEDGAPFRTEEKFSVTTSKHINKYLGKGIGRVVPQSYIEELVK